jgi:hypothetical protein
MKSQTLRFLIGMFPFLRTPPIIQPAPSEYSVHPIYRVALCRYPDSSEKGSNSPCRKTPQRLLFAARYRDRGLGLPRTRTGAR